VLAILIYIRLEFKLWFSTKPHSFIQHIGEAPGGDWSELPDGVTTNLLRRVAGGVVGGLVAPNRFGPR